MFCPWCGAKNRNEAVYCETCGRHLQTGTRPATHLSSPSKVAQAKQRHLPWRSWVAESRSPAWILGIVLSSIKGDRVTLAQHITVTQPGEVSRHYLSSADLRSYTLGSVLRARARNNPPGAPTLLDLLWPHKLPA